MVPTEDKHMLSTNINDYDYTERERIVLDLYNRGKTTRDIAKDLRMSLRDISSILRKNHVSHGVVIMGDGSSNNNNNNKKFKMNR
jgi:DNA-binding NarL/FixJ family response regulator